MARWGRCASPTPWMISRRRREDGRVQASVNARSCPSATTDSLRTFLSRWSDAANLEVAAKEGAVGVPIIKDFPVYDFKTRSDLTSLSRDDNLVPRGSPAGVHRPFA